MRAALVEAAQVEGAGPGPSLGSPSPSPLRGSTGRNSGKHLGTVRYYRTRKLCRIYYVLFHLGGKIHTPLYWNHHSPLHICNMHDEMTVQRQQFHSAAKCWQFQGNKGTAIPPLLWERDQTVRMDSNPSRGAHQWTNGYFVSTKTGGSIFKGSNKRTLKHLRTMPKPLTVWITINCRKFWKTWEYQTTWPASWETYMQVRKQQLELNMAQQTGSK